MTSLAGLIPQGADPLGEQDAQIVGEAGSLPIQADQLVDELQQARRGGEVGNQQGIVTLGHRCGSVAYFAGSFFPRCVCTHVGSPCLTEEGAWLQPCEAEALWRAGDEREARIVHAATVGGVVRS